MEHSTPDRENECYRPSHTPSPSVLSESTERFNECSEPEQSGLQDICSAIPKQSRRTELVGYQNGKKEQIKKEIDLIIDSDASLTGWGAACLGLRIGSPWSGQEMSDHINCLELQAATLALQTFTKDRRGTSVLLRIDDTTAVAYINNRGGTA